MLVLSAFFGVISGVLGIYFSVIFDVSSGSTIVLIASIIFGLAFFFSPKQGVVWKTLRSRMQQG
jgi:manganese transport system permease protein